MSRPSTLGKSLTPYHCLRIVSFSELLHWAEVEEREDGRGQLQLLTNYRYHSSFMGCAQHLLQALQGGGRQAVEVVRRWR